MNKAARRKVMKEFAESPEIIGMTTFNSGSEGHNWQDFEVVIILDRLWNPQVSIYFYLPAYSSCLVIIFVRPSCKQ